MILDLFFISCLVALILLIWFHTEAFLEYVTLVGGNRFFLVDDFRKKQSEAGSYPSAHMDYVNYLIAYHDGFFIRLITCPICFSFWLTLITCFFTGSWMLLPICNILALLIYKMVAKVIVEH